MTRSITTFLTREQADGGADLVRGRVEVVRRRHAHVHALEAERGDVAGGAVPHDAPRDLARRVGPRGDDGRVRVVDVEDAKVRRGVAHAAKQGLDGVGVRTGAVAVAVGVSRIAMCMGVVSGERAWSILFTRSSAGPGCPRI